MIQQIEEELDRECFNCKYHNECQKYDCIVYKLLKIMSIDDETTKINIDDFFELPNKNQMSLFDGDDEQ